MRENLIMPIKTFNITNDKLYDLFINQNFSRKQVADYYGCSEVLVKKKCQEYGIRKPKHLENENKKRKAICVCLWCNRKYTVSLFRTKNQRWSSKYCSHKCSSDSRYLGEEHKRAMLNSVAAKRRANLKLAHDESANEKKIQDFYIKARRLTEESGIRHEVDHIIPISKGGKHHEDNLQILTRRENRHKAAKHDL